MHEFSFALIWSLSKIKMSFFLDLPLADGSDRKYKEEDDSLDQEIVKEENGTFQ